VVLLELFPFGRHALAFELAPLLFALGDDRARRGPAAPRVVVSVRDILVSKANAAWSELAVLAVVLQWVDRVLVHGAPDVIPLERTFSPAARLGERLVYTGYLAPSPPAAPVSPHGEVVVSGGGGQVAATLFRAGLLAARGLVRVLSEATQSPATLAQTMDAALTDPAFPAPAHLALDGARRSVTVVAELAAAVRAGRR